MIVEQKRAREVIDLTLDDDDEPEIERQVRDNIKIDDLKSTRYYSTFTKAQLVEIYTSMNGQENIKRKNNEIYSKRIAIRENAI